MLNDLVVGKCLLHCVEKCRFPYPAFADTRYPFFFTQRVFCLAGNLLNEINDNWISAERICWHIELAAMHRAPENPIAVSVTSRGPLCGEGRAKVRCGGL